ncbi:MAG: hypothetical protein RLN96_03340, partial [Pseudomonadales bacterium]
FTVLKMSPGQFEISNEFPNGLGSRHKVATVDHVENGERNLESRDAQFGSRRRMENANKEVSTLSNLRRCGHGSPLVDYGAINDGRRSARLGYRGRSDCGRHS